MNSIRLIIIFSSIFLLSCSPNIKTNLEDNQIKIVKECLLTSKDSIIKFIQSNRDSILDLKHNTFEVYSKNGKLIEIKKYENDKSIYQTTKNDINSDGKLVKGEKLNSIGKVKETWNYIYDDKDNLIEVQWFDENGNYYNKQVSKYDENGNCIEFTMFKSNGKISYKNTYSYYENGNKKKQERFESDGSLKDKRSYKYDNKGNEIEEILIKNDGTITTFLSEYDELNNITEHRWFNEKGEQTHRTSFEYVYDKRGNWITKKRSSNGVLGLIWERKIEYFD